MNKCVYQNPSYKCKNKKSYNSNNLSVQIRETNLRNDILSKRIL